MVAKSQNFKKINRKTDTQKVLDFKALKIRLLADTMRAFKPGFQTPLLCCAHVGGKMGPVRAGHQFGAGGTQNAMRNCEPGSLLRMLCCIQVAPEFEWSGQSPDRHPDRHPDRQKQDVIPVEWSSGLVGPFNNHHWR